MQAIKCELCGSNQLIKKDGFFQCEHCGTKYTLEEARKLIVSGTVEVVTGNAEKERLMKNAETFLKIGEIKEALLIYKKINENYPGDYNAWKNTLMIIVNYGYCLLTTSSWGVPKFELTNNIQYLSAEFVKVYNAYKETANINEDQKKYANIYYDNLRKGKISFCDTYSIPTIESLSKIFTPEQVEQFLTLGKKYAKYYNFINSINTALFYFGKSISYDTDCSSRWEVSNIVADEEYLLNKVKEKQNSLKGIQLCQHCGGELKGLFKKVCSKCVKPKDY